MINQYTGIDTRSAVGTVDHPIANMDRAPTITELCKVFLKDGVALAVTASRKALHEAQLSPLDITHVVSTTCTNSANPGFDHFVCKELGMTQPVEKVLLHGIGCSGGLASLRTAANLALGASFRARKARVLVVALEISSIMVRSELDSINELQQTRIGVTLFSDCASACVLSNGIGEEVAPVYELLGWDHRIIPDTEEDLGFDVDPLGLFPTCPHSTCPPFLKIGLMLISEKDGKSSSHPASPNSPAPQSNQHSTISSPRCPTFHQATKLPLISTGHSTQVEQRSSPASSAPCPSPLNTYAQATTPISTMATPLPQRFCQ